MKKWVLGLGLFGLLFVVVSVFAMTVYDFRSGNYFESMKNLVSEEKSVTVNEKYVGGTGEDLWNSFYASPNIPSFSQYVSWCNGEDLSALSDGRSIRVSYFSRYNDWSGESRELNFFDTMVITNLPLSLTNPVYHPVKTYFGGGAVVGNVNFSLVRDSPYLLSNDRFKGFVVYPACFPVDGGKYGLLQDAWGRGYPENVISVLGRGSSCVDDLRIYVVKMGVSPYNLAYDKPCGVFTMRWS